ncbi:MAG: bifunctional riboflavin kinase/FAD synthetase [Actinomycetota bacterium]|nr:bifunctional riboflavin kinase/FAD synthetase [Actinomycetota bacterium]
MQVLRSPEEVVRPAGGSAVTIGAYDGVHLGHRDLIRRTRAEAARLGATSVLVTFDRHPATMIRPESAPKLLTDLDQKLELLAATGVALALIVPFDEARAHEPAEDFVRTVLADALGVRSVLVGADFHFGRGRRGNVGMLTAMGAELGFEVTGIPLLVHGDEAVTVTSTRIRGLVSDGLVEEAAVLLGRPHQVRGVVGQGDSRGRDLGYPTANLSVLPTLCLPADGVYAGWYHRPDGTRHRSALSLGRRPTFYRGADRSLLEAHLLDFDGDLYDEAASVDFVSRLRGQTRFDSVDELITQMDRDVKATRELLS